MIALANNNGPERLHSLDALRAGALLLGIALHASMSFIPGMFPGIWSTLDNSPSVPLGQFFFVTHIFRMTLFFFVAGFFARLLYQRAGVGGFLANRATRILLPLTVGWCVLNPAVGAVWTWGIKEYFNGNLPPMMAQMKAAMPAGYFPVIHLWFLYYLVLLYPLALLVRGAVARLDRAGKLRAAADRVLRGLFAGPWSVIVMPVLLGAPAAALLYSSPRWLLWGGIPTPDSTLVPQLIPLVAYGVAIGFGWMMHRQLDLLGALKRRWALHLAVAVGATVYLLGVAGTKFVFVPVPMNAQKVLVAGAYMLATWSYVLGLTGLAMQVFARESAVRRYVADASYWLYLVHLPIVGAGAVIVAKWNVHWGLKFAFIMVAGLALMFASYHFLVRNTIIGECLNGRRHARKPQAAASVAVLPAVSRPQLLAGASPERFVDAVAMLEGVDKTFGAVQALAHVDVQIRRGELTALLGPNGAGKSTAISLWLGLAQPDAGTATLLGGKPNDVARRRRMGVMMQDVNLTHGMRVRELIDQAAAYYVNPMSADEAIALTGIESLAKRVYDKLSGGQKRQVQFALAIVGRPELLFLDEPTAGLDVQAREAMWVTIRRLLDGGCSVVLTTHYLEEAEALANRVIVLAKGRVIADGSVEQLRGIVSRRQVSCDSTVQLDELRSWPGVLDARREGTRLHIITLDAEALLRRLLAGDASLRNLEVRQAGLAEAFTELTREAA